MQCAALTGCKTWTVEEDACAIDNPRLAARQLTLGNMIRMLLLGPAADPPVLLVLPLAGLQLLDRLRDPLLILGIGEMGAQSAASVMRAIGIDALAALTID